MTRKILLLATLTLIGFPLIGWVILWIFDGPAFPTIFQSDYHLVLQVAIGAITGFVAGWMAWIMIRSKYMDPVRDKYSDIIGAFKLRPAHIIYVSLCAGIGEEILFRGVIQQYLGIWITAIFFVAIHGYLDPRNPKLMVYGVFMTLIIALIGWQSEKFGLTTAMLAHTVIDIVLLHQMSKQTNSETNIRHIPFTGEDEQE